MRKLLTMMVLMLAITISTAAKHDAKVQVKSSPASTQITVSSADTMIEMEDSLDSASIAVVSPSVNGELDQEDLKELKEAFGASGTVAGVVAVVAIVFGTLFLIAPLLIIGLVCYFIFRKREPKSTSTPNNAASGYAASQQESAQQPTQQSATANQPTPQPTAHKSVHDEQWSKGVMNVCTGIGVAIFLYFLTDSTALASIGVLIACIGVGKIIVARHYEKDDALNEQD